MFAKHPSDAPALGSNLLPLLRELGDLKRVVSAQADGSCATRLFFAAWADLIGGVSLRDVVNATVVNALVATRLGDVNRALLISNGLSLAEATEITGRAFDDATAVLGPEHQRSLRASLHDPRTTGSPEIQSLPTCLHLLARQPRAGVTSPGRQRLMLHPQELHSEHCLLVAVYGALIAPTFGADAEPVFLAGLSHHFHNAYIPDTGYSGEILIGAHLDRLADNAWTKALSQFPSTLQTPIRSALAEISASDTPISQSFHAADVLDRVLEIEQHFKLADLSMHHVLGDYGLVHAGPNKAFHDHVLKSVGLLL